MWMAALFPLGAWLRRARPFGAGALDASAFGDDALFGALASAVLPAELGSAGRARVVGDFRRWIGGYRPGAELVHGYGTPEIRYAGAGPAPRWARQMRALESDARRAHGRAFVALTDAERRGAV